MSDERLRELLESLPDEREIQSRAARARTRALARLDERRPVARGWFWAPAAVALATLVVIAGLLLHGSRPSPPVVAQRSPVVQQKQENLRMKWVLSNGTRVLWTFREDFKL